MPLVVHLRKGQQVIVNGAVLENANDRNISIILKNEVAVLRSDDIIPPSAAVTPASRAYYALQCAYLFPDKATEHLAEFHELVALYEDAAPSAREITAGVRAAADAGKLYIALKAAQSLIEHERKVLSHVETRLAEKLHDTAAGKPAKYRGVGACPSSAPDEGRSERG